MICLLMTTQLYTVKAQWNGPKEKPKEIKTVKYGALTPLHRQDDAMIAFRSYGLGQFIHWGIYAIAGNEWNGVSARDGAPASEWIRSWSGSTAPNNWSTIYDNLYKTFNPINFDAKRWAKQAKSMGAKYVIFTTKHHDGFALWPTKYSSYNISKSPYKKDVVKEIVDAYTAEGIDVYLYFSVLEWNNPNYMSKKPTTDDDKKKFRKFLEYTRNQLVELLTNYPQIKGFWFDGTWDASWIGSYEFTYDLEKELRTIHPGLIIGSRFRNDEFGMRHFDSNGVLLGDYEQGWERKLPQDKSWLEGNDWDCVMTIPPNGWGYMKDWSGLYTKTTYDIIELMMRSVSMDGNFVLNFGPDGTGNMHAGEDVIAAELGDWMKINSEAVYGVHSSDFAKTNYGYYTQKDSILYLTIFNRPVNDIVRIIVDKNARNIPKSVEILGFKDVKLLVQHADIGFDLDKNSYYDIHLPSDYRNNQPFVLKIHLEAADSQFKKLMDAKM